MTKQLASYIIPVEVCRLTPEQARLSDGAKVQIGRLIANGGLHIRHNPGLREIGINDRGDVMLRLDQQTAEDQTIGPVLNAYNTTQASLTSRLVARIDKKTHERDVKEARAWLEAMAVLSDEKTLRARFLSAGVQCEHRGNIDQLYRTTQANFFQLNDPVALELQTALEDFYVKYTLYVCLERQDRRLVTLHALHAHIQDLFNEHGVQIMSPNYVFDPAAPKIVPRKDWYAAPAAPEQPAAVPADRALP